MPIALVSAAHDFRRACQEARVDGELALVPTMGSLHAGHQSLIREAALRAPTVAVTIFVNPAQFGPSEGLSKYPRDLQSDLRKCEEAGATFVFAPDATEIYPPGFQTWVEPRPLARRIIEEAGLRLDYAEIRDRIELQRPARAEASSRLFLAAFIGDTRLIDNGELA